MKTAKKQYDGFHIALTKPDYERINQPGRSDETVKEILQKKYVARQFTIIDPEDIKDQLKGFGAYTPEELNDTEQNKARIIWIAAGDIQEDLTN